MSPAEEYRREQRRLQRENEPTVDASITPNMLDRQTRSHLRSLNKENADAVARHLVAAGELIDDDPETAHQHAVAAQRRAGRIDVVREAVALTAYATGRYADALREARTVRRLSGDESLRAIEADSERGLGRPERALAVIGEVNLAEQPAALRSELAIVASGARADLGEFDAGLLVIEDALRFIRDRELRGRLLSVKADRLDDLGRHEDAEATRSEIDEPEDDPESVLYIDDTIDEDLALALQLEEAEGAEEPSEDDDAPAEEPDAEETDVAEPDAEEPDADEPDAEEPESEELIAEDPS